MVTSAANVAEVVAFSERLNELLDARRFSEKGKGRQTALAKALSITQNGARKWLEAEGMPEFHRQVQIAKLFDCHIEWLATGRGPRDVHPEAASPHRRLVDRLNAADPETVRLVEMALLENDPKSLSKLSPSLVAMVRGLKAAIKLELQA